MRSVYNNLPRKGKYDWMADLIFYWFVWWIQTSFAYGKLTTDFFYKKSANLGLFFIYFWSFSNKQYHFYNKSMWKMSIQYTAPGFEPRPLEHELSLITTRPGLPSYDCSYRVNHLDDLIRSFVTKLFEKSHKKASFGLFFTNPDYTVKCQFKYPSHWWIIWPIL